ncbi:excisionase family DNA-binding protein [Bradyrhizobium sp. BRP22]|uniref:GAF domain-containing protein n=1 Tax=Bradyrhizobium sp. BRP22 TaxID=2793821 RepID=UPI001CD6A205|nr:GAF domain-containing protein [Bradyrhizobium sp. BRP22]MCA1457777.1 excisionase family DNA-binding protein [Bradyrhizobium sp. BRP22]
MDKDILTTSQAAKLLGISVRTAQLLIEGGSLISWKTPGGHRRVYRADVLTLMARRSAVRDADSARVLLLASPERLSILREQLAAIGGCTVEAYTSAYAASSSIGSRAPAAVVVDVDMDGREGTSFLDYLASSSVIRMTKLIGFGGASSFPSAIAARLHAMVSNPRELTDAIRIALKDLSEPAELLPGEASFPLALNETQRLAALERSGLLGAEPLEALDELTWLASYSVKTPIALVTLLTSNHQFFKSRQGLEMTETPRSWAFCNYTILQRGIFAVDDLSLDERFVSNPAVAGEPYFRFYAGVPIVDADGFALGSLCVIDREPRRLDADQERLLRLLAKLASGEVQSRATQGLLSGPQGF